MSDTQLNLLQASRRRSKLTQGDIQFLAGHASTVSISRYEKGNRVPSIDILMLYHILFDVPLKYLLPDLYEATKESLIEQCTTLHAQLNSQKTGLQWQERLTFLEQTIIRLTTL